NYVNGEWVRSTEIPADRSSYSIFSALSEQTQKDTRAILESASTDVSAEGDRKKIGACYAAYMDEPGIEAKGAKPVQAELDAIAAIADKAALASTFGAQLRADVDLLNATDYHTDRLLGLWITANLLKPDEYAPYLVQGGLGMPDRDFYLEDGRMVELRAEYQAHIARVLTLVGITDAEARASRILALETMIARAHVSQLETGDVEKGANTWSRADFDSRAPGIDWSSFLDAAGLSDTATFIVWQPTAVSGIAAVVASQPLGDWQDYLQFHALERASPYLSKAFVDEHFAFNGTALSGTPQLGERWKRGVEECDNVIGEAVGKIYVQEHFTPETKARANDMVRNVLAAFGKRIDAAEWMSAETKARARSKLEGTQVGMGYPDRWRDYSGLEVRSDDAYGNAQRALLFDYHRNLAKLGQPIDRGEWYMSPQTVNALNVPLENRLIFPAAILQAPFFDAAADDAINYGAIGGVIGHEISHSFDNMGALFDETGKLDNWWTKEDFARFEAAGAALAAQYDTYKPFPDLAVNGELTLSENIADVAGLATAYDAYTMAQAGSKPIVLDGFSPDQRVFLGWAQAWRGKYREKALRNAVLTNVHAPGPYRAQTVRNIDGWYDAFDVKEEQALYLVPEQRVKVW
ncbi:M13 family metallopeptidase, partial [Dokdonella sp.]|uniref:M13 family metallopeptidase n=1 Tax=Dokdonella sp. TaxID=2291710 RepID=UPI003C4B523F